MFELDVVVADGLKCPRRTWDVCVSEVDVIHPITDDLWAGRTCDKDVAFRASGNQETEVGWKVAIGDLLGNGL